SAPTPSATSAAARRSAPRSSRARGTTASTSVGADGADVTVDGTSLAIEGRAMANLLRNGEIIPFDGADARPRVRPRGSFTGLVGIRIRLAYTRRVPIDPSQTRASEWVVTVDTVFPNQANPLGTLFGGRVIELMDVNASIACARFCRAPVVTASTEPIDFR